MVEVHQFDLFCVDPCQLLVQWNANPTIPFLPLLAAGMIQKDTTHQSRREAVEMFAIFEAQASLAYELEK